ncbi:DUF2878 domain-containing protein [Roseateles noduli]|uniref:DUF2878 domain-containing protein n=1 Tax=Roseateles noduli TaxID=2052484 RepID=UPI003D648556
MKIPTRPVLKRLLIGIVQFCLFQGAWFACVYGAAQAQAGWGVLAVAAVVLVSWRMSDRPVADITLAAQAVLMGLAWDTWMLRGDWVHYASPGPLEGWAPVWILALWALFATLLRGPLSWLHGRPLLAAALGAVGGPLSYLAAVRLGAGSFPAPGPALAVLAAGWGVMTPVLTESARWFSRAPGNLQAPSPR